MSALPTDELLDIVVFDAADYESAALELAREELRMRGCSEVDLQNWRESEAGRRANNSDLLFDRMRFALIVFVTVIVTFCLFAPLIYYSIVAYGIPCAIFIGAGYLIWLALRRNDPPQAHAFAIGFACGVFAALIPVATAVPWYAGLIVAECLGLWILIKVVRYN